jgi:hypothetical protein
MNETFFCTLKRRYMFYDETVEMITECIGTCHEIILFGHGYKSFSLRGARDQFEDVKSLIKYFRILRSYSFFTTQ